MFNESPLDANEEEKLNSMSHMHTHITIGNSTAKPGYLHRKKNKHLMPAAADSINELISVPFRLRKVDPFSYF